MKKFIVDEEEKLRILNLHESLRESILTPTKSTLNENVGPGLVRLLQGFKTTLKGSASIMSNLDDLARTFRNSGKIYGGNMRSGQDLLELFLAGSLSNRGVGDDMGVTLLTIFRSADDAQLIRSLSKEMVDGDVLLRKGLLDGSINAVTEFGTKQGDELMDYVYRAYGRPTPFDPGGRYNPNPQFGGSWNSNVAPYYGAVSGVKPDYVMSKLRGLFPNNQRVKKYLDGAKNDIESFIPNSLQEANDIVSNNRQLIEEMLKKRNVPQRLWDTFIDQLIAGWPLKAAMGFFGALAIAKLTGVILTITGQSGWSPIIEFAKIFGLDTAVEAARARLCADGSPWACKAGSGGGGSGEGALDK